MTEAAPLHIRAPRPTDAEAMHALERACFTDPWPLSSFVSICTGRGQTAALAERDSQVIGYWVGQRIDDEAELANLAVMPALRGHGIGRRLLADFLVTVGAETRTIVYLEVRASNAVAQALYADAGFIEIDRRRGYYTKPLEDALVMVRRPGAVDRRGD